MRTKEEYEQEVIKQLITQFDVTEETAQDLTTDSDFVQTGFDKGYHPKWAANKIVEDNA